MPYVEIKIIEPSKETAEILIALLADLQYEGFEETQQHLKAFIPEQLFNKEQLDEIANQFELKYTVNELPDVNWNKEWESNFQPVIIENFCAVRAGFHEPRNEVQHEIIITPKMSFGTGHHATTYMMIEQMRDINFAGKKVIDFGTGTGVLAILAHKSGAAKIVAVDNDEWSINNAAENFKMNNIDDIDLKPGDYFAAGENFDVILANITRNVILENFEAFQKSLTEKGILLLSGLLPEDENSVTSSAMQFGFLTDKKLQRENWISIKLSKQ